MTTPLNWSYRNLGSFGEFAKGSGIKKSEVTDRGVPCVRYGEIYTHHGTTIKSFNSFIKPEVAKNSVKLKQNDILFACSGETKAEIGKSTVFTGNQEAYAGGDIIILSPNGVDSIFLGYALQSSDTQRQKVRSGKGDAVVHISAKDLSEIKILLPNEITEQQAIAKALSDIDELIETITTLIEKKKKLFSGALNSEFSYKNGSVRTKLSNICLIEKGTPVTYDKDLQVGEYGFLNGGIEFSGTTNNFNDPGNTVVISEGGNSCGYVNYIPVPFWCGGHAYRLMNFQGLQKYLYYSLKYSEKDIMNLRVGSGLPNIQKKNLANFEIAFHSDKLKQELLVSFLDSLTNEIETLKLEKSKYECIKQGMAHDLLTGKVRLV